MPPVGGALRTKVLATFASSAAATGGAAGLFAGSLWEVAGLPRAGTTAGFALFALAVVADLLRLPVLCTRRQVPQEWGRLLPPVTVALLYGARLGVGPLTILNSWLWWAGLVLGASRGPWVGLLVGLVFGATRAVVTAAAGMRRSPSNPGRKLVS